MGIDLDFLPTYVQEQLPHLCYYCGYSLDHTHIALVTLRWREVTPGESLYHTTDVEFQCPCQAATVIRYVDWQRTE